MKSGVLYTGVPSKDELKAAPGCPSEERMKKGRVAVIECVQEIPCNPCETACPFGAISVGQPITNLPELNEEKCTGCGQCVAACPGLAIFIVDKSYSEEEALVEFPFEYRPLPEVGNIIDVVNREGQVIGKGEIKKIRNPKTFNNTSVLTVAVPQELVGEARSIKRLPR